MELTWVIEILHDEINKLNMKLKSGVHSKKYFDQIEILEKVTTKVMKLFIEDIEQKKEMF